MVGAGALVAQSAAATCNPATAWAPKALRNSATILADAMEARLGKLRERGSADLGLNSSVAGSGDLVGCKPCWHKPSNPSFCKTYQKTPSQL